MIEQPGEVESAGAGQAPDLSRGWIIPAGTSQAAASSLRASNQAAVNIDRVPTSQSRATCTHTMDPEAIRACHFAAWYPAFKDVAFSSRIIELPAAFVDYLVQDGVFLREGSDAVRAPKLQTVCNACNSQGWRTQNIAQAGLATLRMPSMQLPRRATPAPHEDYEPWEEEAAHSEADPQLEAAQVLWSASRHWCSFHSRMHACCLHAWLKRAPAGLCRCRSSRS